MIHADFIWWKSLLLCYSEALHKSFHHCQPSSSPKKWFSVPQKQNELHTHIIIPNTVWQHQGSFKFSQTSQVLLLLPEQSESWNRTTLPTPSMNQNQKLPKRQVTLTTTPSFISLSAITFKICLTFFKINFNHMISGLWFYFEFKKYDESILQTNFTWKTISLWKPSAGFCLTSSDLAGQNKGYLVHLLFKTSYNLW